MIGMPLYGAVRTFVCCISKIPVRFVCTRIYLSVLMARSGASVRGFVSTFDPCRWHSTCTVVNTLYIRPLKGNVYVHVDLS